MVHTNIVFAAFNSSAPQIIPVTGERCAVVLRISGAKRALKDTGWTKSAGNTTYYTTLTLVPASESYLFPNVNVFQSPVNTPS